MELKALYQHGWSISALAREFGLNRRTVKRELESESPRQYSQRAKPTELSAAQLAQVERRLAVCPTIRGTDLHAELKRGYGYAGSYPAFARHLLTLRPLMVKEPEIRFETGPGVQTQADWADLACVDGTNQNGAHVRTCFSTPGYNNWLNNYWWIGWTYIDEYNSSGAYIGYVSTYVPQSLSGSDWWCVHTSGNWAGSCF